MEEDIADGDAYMWDEEAYAFSTGMMAATHFSNVIDMRLGLERIKPDDGRGSFHFEGYYNRPSMDSSWSVNKKYFEQYGENDWFNPSWAANQFWIANTYFDYIGTATHCKAKASPPQRKCRVLKYHPQNGPAPVGLPAWEYIQHMRQKRYFYYTEHETTVYMNVNFETLKGYMTDLQKEDESKFNNFSRLYSFRIPEWQQYPVYIANPMYYWDVASNGRWNGYGMWYARGHKDGAYQDAKTIAEYTAMWLRQPTLQGGVYWPAEKCYFIVNRTRPSHWWGVTPYQEVYFNDFRAPIKIENYDFAPMSPMWTDTEWAKDSADGKPSQYD